MVNGLSKDEQNYSKINGKYFLSIFTSEKDLSNNYIINIYQQKMKLLVLALLFVIGSSVPSTTVT